MTFLYLDTETCGLDLEHDIWEIGYAFDDEPVQSFIVHHDPSNMSAEAAEVNRYHVRDIEIPDEDYSVRQEARLLTRIRRASAGPYDKPVLVGANPAFDAERLLQRWKIKPSEAPWHYRLLDIETFAMPLSGASTPMSLVSIASYLRGSHGFSIPEPDHTAAGDVETTRAVHRALVESYRNGAID